MRSAASSSSWRYFFAYVVKPTSLLRMQYSCCSAVQSITKAHCKRSGIANASLCRRSNSSSRCQTKRCECMGAAGSHRDQGRDGRCVCQGVGSVPPLPEPRCARTCAAGGWPRGAREALHAESRHAVAHLRRTSQRRMTNPYADDALHDSSSSLSLNALLQTHHQLRSRDPSRTGDSRARDYEVAHAEASAIHHASGRIRRLHACPRGTLAHS